MTDELKFGMDKAPSLLKWLTDLDNNPKSHTETWCDGWNVATNNLVSENANLTAKLKLAVEALEHYANNAHWDEYEDEFNGESGWYSIFNKTVDFGNKVAEAALKQIGEPAKGRDI